MAGTVKLKSSDDDVIEVKREVATMCVTVKNMLEDIDNSDDVVVPLPNVSSELLKKVVEYCEYHLAHPGVDEEKQESVKHIKFRNEMDCLCDWDVAFVNSMELKQVFDMILAANYLEIKPLLDVNCRKVASLIKGLSEEEIRKIIKVKMDFTPEEEAIIRASDAWEEEAKKIEEEIAEKKRKEAEEREGKEDTAAGKGEAMETDG